MRGIAFISAVTFVVEIGDVRRFETAPQLMAYLGLVPSESSTGERVTPSPATCRHTAFWLRAHGPNRFPARVSPGIQARLDGLPRTAARSHGKARSGCAPATAS